MTVFKPTKTKIKIIILKISEIQKIPHPWNVTDLRLFKQKLN